MALLLYWGSPQTSKRAVSHRPSHGNLYSNEKHCPLHGKFTIKHEKQTLQVKATVKLNGVHVDYCTSIFGVSHHSSHEVKRHRLPHFLFWCKSLSCHGKVNGIDYSTSLFGVSHHPLLEVKRRRLLYMLHWALFLHKDLKTLETVLMCRNARRNT